MSGKEFKGPKSFSDELRRMPIDFQRRVKWTLRIGAVWAGTVLIGSGVFLLSRPYMDRRREEKIKSGEFFEEIRKGSEPYSHLKRSWEKPNLNARDNKDIEPPPYLLDVISDVLESEKTVECSHVKNVS